ncbi:MAG: gliding motility-associated C-terminal domain-containing protein [Bacteroidia bacterium]|nr:gliding motility-associated C-terminal domain-containing protein [Bacteroidia bacterium]
MMQNMVVNWGNNLTTNVASLNQIIKYNYAQRGNYAAKLVVASNHGCKDSLTLPLVIHAKPIANFIPLPTEGCEPLCVTFANTSSQNEQPISEKITTQKWTFGDYNVEKSNDDKSTKLNANHCYTNPSDTTQLHTPMLIVSTSEGCKDTLTLADTIAVYSLPAAGFKAAPTNVNMLNPEIKITDQSHLAYTITWNYGNGNSSNVVNINPLQFMRDYVYTYTDSGTYIIKQLVQTDKGCADSVSHPVRINPIYTLYVPNSFTPNGDNINEYFMVKGVNIKDVDLIIFNRYGELIARVQNMSSKGWDGTDLRQDKLSQQEVYTWKLEYTDVFNIKHKGLVGTVTLIR